MKDPYLKPIIFGGLTTTLLSIIFAPGIFLWSIIGGYSTIRVINKTSKEIVTILDSILIGIFSGIIGGTCLNILTVITFKDPENKRLLISTLTKSWPKDMQPIPNFYDSFGQILISTCGLILLVCVLFSIIGTWIGYITNKKQKENKPS